jgi:hypothetical protein
MKKDGVCPPHMHELHGDQLEALLLETLEDLADNPALDTVGLDHDEGPLLVGLGSHFGVLIVD